MNQPEILQDTIRKMEAYHERKHIVAGFDGFVDEIIHVVDKRQSHESYDRIKDITAFSKRIAASAGLSANIEMVPVQTKLGGNGPIMANALISLGQEITYIGAIGKQHIDPVFADLADNCREVISLTDPGHTDALEFYDGKIMMGKMHTMVEVNAENLLAMLPKEKLAELLSETDLVAFTNWTMLSNLNGIISLFGELMESSDKPPAVFIDLADPQKRTTADIREVIRLISALPCDTILGMNMNESRIIAEVLEIQEEDAVARAAAIQKDTGIDAIVIHPVHGAAVATSDTATWVEGPYTKKPKLTTGAGDNFNAGFCNGWLGGFTPAECLMAGVCTSGYYVRNAQSPSHDELLQFMRDLANN